MAYVALFVALGGTSWAVATGSVDSRAIRNESVRSADLRDNEVRSRDIHNRTIVGRDLLSNTLGGDHIDEKELGEIPLATRAKSADDALALGGVSAADIIAATEDEGAPPAPWPTRSMPQAPGRSRCSSCPASARSEWPRAAATRPRTWWASSGSTAPR